MASQTSRNNIILVIKTALAYVSLVISYETAVLIKTSVIKTSVADPDHIALACKSPFDDLRGTGS